MDQTYYRAFFENSRDSMFITKREGFFEEVNQSFCKLLGYSREELLKLPVEQTYALPMERRRFRYEVETNGAVSNFRIKLVNKAQEELFCTIDAVSIRDKAGEIEGYIGMIRQVKNPAMLLNVDPEAQAFALAIRGSNDGLWNWDLVKKEVSYSARWKALLGYSSMELSKSVNEWFDRVHPEDLMGLKQSLNKYLKGDSQVFASYFRVQTKGLEYIWMQARGVGEFDENGKCSRLAGSFTNITHHIKIVENLKNQEHKLAEMNTSLASDKALLSRYFSGDMLAMIMGGSSASIQESLGPAAILVVHINKTMGLWTRIGEEKYAAFLNELMTDLMDLIYGHRGSVNKILGDSLLVSFGCPIAGDDDLTQALDCALELKNYMATYNDVRPDFLTEDLFLSMGISYGEVFSGTIGSVHRLEYTLVGVPVGRAASLQQLAEKHKCPLLCDLSVVESTPNPELFKALNPSVYQILI